MEMVDKVQQDPRDQQVQQVQWVQKDQRGMETLMVEELEVFTPQSKN
jgi:hypothetical protein